MRLVSSLTPVLFPFVLVAQQQVTRADAVAAALARGARVALARADTTAAVGAAREARALPNPPVSGSYTKDTPNYHALGELPLDLPWLRGARIGAAESARDAARYRFDFERAAIRFDVDTTYTRSLAAALHARLSHRTALDADSLLRIAELRREVGDVSELDVRLAAGNAGQLENIAAHDSLAALETLLSLQLQMGLSGNEPTVVLVDSLRPPPHAALTERRALLPIAAAEPAPRSAGLVERANRVAAMSLQAYSEGAIPLANVLEAQRNAREILARYIDDLATADAAARALKLLPASPDEP